MMRMKFCRKCDRWLPENNFCRDRATKNGRYSYCRECCSRESRERYKKNRVGIARQSRQRYKDSKQVQEARRQYRLKHKYGLTPEQHRQIYLDQGERCALCGDSMPYDWLYTDHDHQTAKVRGLLCCSCNTGLGHLDDSVEGLRRAIEYLEKSQ